MKVNMHISSTCMFNKNENVLFFINDVCFIYTSCVTKTCYKYDVFVQQSTTVRITSA